MAARSSSTKSRTCRCPPRPSCCAPFRTSRSSASAAPAAAASTCESSPQRTGAWRAWSPIGMFRADVFYRLSGVEVHVPPLRFRKTDVLELTQHFLARHQNRGRYTMTAAAVDALMAYDWPGNVRELERMIEGAVAIAESRQIRLDDLPASLRGDYAEILMPSAQEDHSMRAWGSRYARLVLERCGWQQARGLPPTVDFVSHAQRVSRISVGAASAFRSARAAPWRWRRQMRLLSTGSMRASVELPACRELADCCQVPSLSQLPCCGLCGRGHAGVSCPWPTRWPTVRRRGRPRAGPAWPRLGFLILRGRHSTVSGLAP